MKKNDELRTEEKLLRLEEEIDDEEFDNDITYDDEEKVNKFKLVKESISKKSKGIATIIRKNPKKSIGIGALTVTAALILTQCGSKNAKNIDIQPVETTTTTTMEEEPIILTTTTPVETITFTTTTTPEEIIVTKAETTTPVETTTTAVTTTAPEEIVVTKAETTTPVETTSTTSTSTTKKPVTTPVVTVEVEEAKPVIIENLDEKVEILKEALTGNDNVCMASDQLLLNTVRVLNSDYIAHDKLDEITTVEYEQVMSLLSSVGSHNSMQFGLKYTGAIPSINDDCLYIPAEILPKDQQKLINASIKVSEGYRLSLNTIESPMFSIALTDSELQNIDSEVCKELDKLNIADNAEWEKKFVELYNAKFEKIYNNKVEEVSLQYSKEVNKEYKEMFKTTKELVNSKEYEKLTPAVKLAFFTNVSGSMISGMNDKYKEQYKSFEQNITSSADEAREDLIVANRKNINQQDALNKIVDNNNKITKQEREDLEELGKSLEDLFEQGKILVK